MNREPIVASLDTAPEDLLKQMNDAMIRQIPLLDGNDRVAGLSHMRDLTTPIENREHWVVLMAGGLGKRLRPLTEEKPKPLLSIGDKPILETILESFVEQKFHKFYISVNYMADAIKRHFGNGAKWNVEIRYLEEKSRLGTVGALGLIPELPEKPLIVMNGDLITRINFQDLIDFHVQQNADATMCVRQYDFQVPYGVIEIEEHWVKAIDEKPIHRFFVNAGIYVLEPNLIKLVPAEKNFDITTLFEMAIAEGGAVTVFPIHEYWLDIGRLDDFERAEREIKK
jgi:NDP-sugar pyrophosphorylase family protein